MIQVADFSRFFLKDNEEKLPIFVSIWTQAASSACLDNNTLTQLIV